MRIFVTPVKKQTEGALDGVDGVTYAATKDEMKEEMSMPPTVTPERALTILKEPPNYDNIGEESYSALDPLDTSLHTVSSDISIDLAEILGKASNNEDDDNLSFQASQIDSSELQEKHTLGIVDSQTNNPEIVDVAKTGKHISSSHDLQMMIHVSQHLLKSQTEEEENTISAKKHLFAIKLIYFLIFAGATLYATRKITVIDEQMKERVDQIYSSRIHEDETTLIVGGIKFYKEPVDASQGSLIFLVLQVVILVLIVHFVASTKKVHTKCETKAEVDGNQIANKSVAGSDASSVDSTHEDENSDNLSVPSLIPIPLDNMKWDIHAYDLTQYKKMKINVIRGLLQSKKCKCVGNKKQMATQLAYIYQKELQILTVVQLQNELKKKKLKQNGAKNQLVRRLVEAGI